MKIELNADGSALRPGATSRSWRARLASRAHWLAIVAWALALFLALFPLLKF
jgi:hypothetical protein